MSDEPATSRSATPAGKSTLQHVREAGAELRQRFHEWRRSRWRRSFNPNGLAWRNLSGGWVHLDAEDDGWRCWIYDGTTDNDSAHQHCRQHATFDMALATAYLWMEYRLTPQTSMDGHPFVPVSGGRPQGAVVMGQSSALYLDDPSDVESLLEMVGKRAERETLREEVEVENP
jgi:hypothetical protein